MKKTIIPFNEKRKVEVQISVNKVVEVIEAKELITNFSSNDFSFTIFVLEELSLKYYLNYDEILIILYLYELVLFGRKVDFFGGWYMIGDLIDKGFADKDSSVTDKDLYRLSEKGYSLVSDYSDGFKKKEKWINENRKIPLTDNSEIKSVINNYFNKK
jgi:hypothetical protein